MREIKFRQPVWENGTIIRWCYWGYKDGLYQHPTNQHESNQFTGLHDKNDKEIYEGDIITDSSHIMVVKFGEYDIGEPGYENIVNGWYVEGYRKYDHNRNYITALIINNFYDVVGNIYENPELMK